MVDKKGVHVQRHTTASNFTCIYMYACTYTRKETQTHIHTKTHKRTHTFTIPYMHTLT